MAQVRSRGFIHGAFSLTLAVVVAKVLGVLYIAPLQNLIGNPGMGLYNIAFPLYTMMLTISTAGFPLAMSKTISFRLALGQQNYANHTFRIASRLLVATGIFCFVVTWSFAPLYARISGNPDATLAIRAIAPALLIVPLVSAYRGYLQGHQIMPASGFSQVVEQIGRVSAIVLGAAIVHHVTHDLHLSAAAATFGGFVGAACSLIYLIFYVKRHEVYDPPSADSPRPTIGAVIRELLRYGLPVSLGSLVLPIANQVDTLTIINLLKHAGMSVGDATAQLGILGNVLRLVQIPLSLAMAMGISLLPAITEVNTLMDTTRLHERIQAAFRMNSIATFGVGATFLALAQPIYQALFKDNAGVVVMESVAIMGVFSSCELITTYMLQGIGRFYLPVGHMFLGVLTKLTLNIALVPTYGIRGAAIATVLGYIVSSALNVRAVLRHSRVDLSLSMIVVRPLLASVVLGCVMWVTRVMMSGIVHVIHQTRLADLVISAIVLCVGTPVYLAMLLATRALRGPELSHLPIIGSFLARWIRRYKLILPQR